MGKGPLAAGGDRILGDGFKRDAALLDFVAHRLVRVRWRQHDVLRKLRQRTEVPEQTRQVEFVFVRVHAKRDPLAPGEEEQELGDVFIA